MSRTWKTRPLDVRMADKHDAPVDILEHHDHLEGKCDLPSNPREQMMEARKTGADTDCYFTWGYKGKNLCGCHMCTDYYGRKWDRRRERHSKAKDINEQL